MLLHIVRNEIKKESWQLVKNKKVIQSQKNVKNMPNKLNIFSLKIHKGAGILKSLENLSK